MWVVHLCHLTEETQPSCLDEQQQLFSSEPQIQLADIVRFTNDYIIIIIVQ